MKFILLDKVTHLEPGKRIVAVKAVTLAEEYLQDHFPAFPVLPGVMMVEALVQTAAMLVRITRNFDTSMVVLTEARNVKYKSFVKPGHTLTLAIEAKSIEADSSSFLAKGTVGDTPMVEARLKLSHFNLADRNGRLASADATIIESMKHRARLVGALS